MGQLEDDHQTPTANRIEARRLAGDAVEAAFNYIEAVSVQRGNRWHDGDVRQWTILEWAGAMCGEAGEAANVAKKIRRAELELVGNKTTGFPKQDLEELRGKLAQECADTFLYLVLLAHVSGIELGRSVIQTFNAKSVEVGFPERL